MDFSCDSGQKWRFGGRKLKWECKSNEENMKILYIQVKDVGIGIVKVTMTGEPTDQSVSFCYVCSRWWQRRIHGSVANHENCVEAHCSTVYLSSHFTAYVQLLTSVEFTLRIFVSFYLFHMKCFSLNA
jgi:hypothetical protein